MNVLDLFSGIGGFSLGLERAGMETVAFCEIDPFCKKVLKKHWPDTPIYNDVRSLDYEGSVDVICGGFPCQPFSVAGKQKGKEDDRHLWPAMFDLIKKHRPRWVIGENVAGLINMGLDDVLTDLGNEGYTTRAFVIPACAVNAPHRRSRVWIVGNAQHDGLTTPKDGRGKQKPQEQERKDQERESSGASSISENVADPTLMLGDGKQNNSIESKRQISESGSAGSKNDVCNPTSAGFPNWSGGEMEQPQPVTEFERPNGREIERNFRGVSHGVSRRVDRLRALGNAVVPQIPEIIGRAIMEIERNETS